MASKQKDFHFLFFLAIFFLSDATRMAGCSCEWNPSIHCCGFSLKFVVRLPIVLFLFKANNWEYPTKPGYSPDRPTDRPPGMQSPTGFVTPSINQSFALCPRSIDRLLPVRHRVSLGREVRPDRQTVSLSVWQPLALTWDRWDWKPKRVSSLLPALECTPPQFPYCAWHCMADTKHVYLLLLPPTYLDGE